MPFPPVPPQEPVTTFYDPNKVDQGLIEYWNSDAATYEPIDVGSPHPRTRDYPNFRLGMQAIVPDQHNWIRRVWVTDETSPDWLNYQVKFAAENDDFPTYIRQYRLDKKTYAPLVKGTPLDSIVILKLLTAGSGYTPGTFPAVTLSGGGGTGFVGHGIVNADGTIKDFIIDEQGTGFTSGPTATVEDPPSGTTATAVAIIQPQTAVLLAEQAEEFPKDSEFFGLYFNVTRVYETLPGPTLDTTRIDEDGVVVTVAKTKKLCSDITPGESIDSGVWTKVTSEPDTSLTCMEVVETRELPGNPMVSTRVDDDGVTVTVTKTLKDTTTITTEETATGGFWSKTSKQAVSDLVANEVDEVRAIPGYGVPVTHLDDDGVAVYGQSVLKDTDNIWTREILNGGFWVKVTKEKVSDLVSNENTQLRAVPGNPIPTAKLDDDGVAVYGTATLKDTNDIWVHEEIVGGNWVRTTKEKVSDLVSTETVETRAIPGNPVVSTKIDEDGKVLTTTATLVDTTTVTSQEQITFGNWVRTYKEKVSDLVATKIVESRPIPGNAVPSTKIDDDGQVVLVTTTLKDESTIVTGETLAAGTWTRTIKQKVSDLVAQEIVETRTIPGPEQDFGQTGKWGVEPVSKQKIEIAVATVDEGYLVKESKFEPFEGSDLVATKITVRYPSNVYGVDLQGQDYDPRLNTVIPYVQQLRPQSYGIGVNFEDITPIDYQHSDVRTIDPTIVAAVLNAYVFSYPGRINVDMPDLLTDVYGVIESSTSDGAAQKTGTSDVVCTSGSIAQALTAQAQASAKIIPEAYPTIKQFWGNNIACTHYHFFLENPVTQADVLTKLNGILSPDTVIDWPKFNPEVVTLVMTGGGVSALAHAESQGSATIVSSVICSSTAGGGVQYSEERELTVKTMRISPTIHDTIYLSGVYSGSENVTATAYAEAAGLGPLEVQTTGPLTVDALITPNTIPATQGATTWPTSGLYLYRTDPHPYRYNFIEFHCIVIDATDFPNVP